jgi:hypothetical protein
MSTPAEDVQALRRAVIDVLHTAPYDDMPWPEIQAALQLTMHDVKIVFASQYGNFNGAPPPFPFPPDAP